MSTLSGQLEEQLKEKAQELLDSEDAVDEQDLERAALEGDAARP